MKSTGPTTNSGVTARFLGSHRKFSSRVSPIAVLVNRSRDLHDALRRRCLYHWIDCGAGPGGRDRAPHGARELPRR